MCSVAISHSSGAEPVYGSAERPAPGAQGETSLPARSVGMSGSSALASGSSALKNERSKDTQAVVERRNRGNGLELAQYQQRCSCRDVAFLQYTFPNRVQETFLLQLDCAVAVREREFYTSSRGWPGESATGQSKVPAAGGFVRRGAKSLRGRGACASLPVPERRACGSPQ